MTTQRLSALAGRGLAKVFAGAAAVRRDKPLHPRGVVVSARLRRAGGPALGVSWLDQPGDDPALVRLSRAVGLPGPLPDVLGLAVRIELDGARHDLLLASSLRPPGLRHLLAPARDTTQAFYSSVFTYRTPRGPVLLGAEPAPGGFDLLVAPPRGEWTTFGTLALTPDGTPSDEPVSFDPVLHPLPGLALSPALAALREPSYAAARRHRPAGSSSTDEREQHHVARLAGAVGT